MNDNPHLHEQAAVPQPAIESESVTENAATEPKQVAEPAQLPVVKEFPAAHAHGPQGIQFAISVLVIVVFMITFVIQAFRVPSESMENTLLIGDFLLADKMHFADGGVGHWLFPYRPIQRGDVVVFRYPVDPTQYFVKRVIGLPGDRIHLLNKAVFVNGVRLDESYVIHSVPDFEAYRDDFPLHERLPLDVNRRWIREMSHYMYRGDLVVPRDQYFVMGDNRDQSLDSRYWGFVPRGNIMGRPLVIYMSINDGSPSQTGRGSSNGKLFDSGQVLAHFLQLARWDRIFHRVL